METISEIKTASNLELLEYISWKDDYPEESQLAFSEFCRRFDQAVIKTAEIACRKWSYSMDTAVIISNCTFEKVWLYSSYNQEKSKSKNIDTGIRRWLNSIVYNQLANYYNNDTCFKPDEETDFSLMYSTDDLANKTTEDKLTIDDLKGQLLVIDDVLSKLGEKHKTIYLTYQAYREKGKYLPRKVSDKLQSELNLSQGSIRKYHEQARNQIKEYLKSN